MRELLEELKNNKKINEEQGLENKVDIDYIIERLEGIYPYREFLLDEIEWIQEEMADDEMYDTETQDKIFDLSKEDINNMVDDLIENEYINEYLYDDIKNKIWDIIGWGNDEI